MGRLRRSSSADIRCVKDEEIDSVQANANATPTVIQECLNSKYSGPMLPTLDQRRNPPKDLSSNPTILPIHFNDSLTHENTQHNQEPSFVYEDYFEVDDSIVNDNDNDSDSDSNSNNISTTDMSFVRIKPSTRWTPSGASTIRAEKLQDEVKAESSGQNNSQQQTIRHVKRANVTHVGVPSERTLRDDRGNIYNNNEYEVDKGFYPKEGFGGVYNVNDDFNNMNITNSNNNDHPGIPVKMEEDNDDKEVSYIEPKIKYDIYNELTPNPPNILFSHHLTHLFGR